MGGRIQDKLHIPVQNGGIFYFHWHRHQTEGATRSPVQANALTHSATTLPRVMLSDSIVDVDMVTQEVRKDKDRVLRVLSGQNSRTFKYISRTKFQNSRTFKWGRMNLLMCKLNVLINIFPSVTIVGTYSDFQKCVNLGSSRRPCVTGRNRSIINKGNLGNFK